MTSLEDAQVLRKAMKGFGTDEKTIIKIIANRTNAQRLEIKDVYEKQIKRDLLKDFKSEVSGNFGDTILALFLSPVEYDVDEIKHAMKSNKINELTLIEIIGSRDESHLNKIKIKYKEKYNVDLEESIEKEPKINLKRLLILLLKGGKSRNLRFDINDCRKKAIKLYEAGEGKWYMYSNVFSKIFSSSSRLELSYICKEYFKLYGHSIIDGINNNYKGDLKKILKSIVYVLVNPSEFFATRIFDSIDGIGTRDRLLIRVIVTRDEIDMPLIQKYYKQIYGKDMIEDIKGDTSGDYRKLLIALVSN